VLSFVVDEGVDCDRRLKDLYNVLWPNNFRYRFLNRARANFAVLLLNLVAGYVPLHGHIGGEGPWGAPGFDGPQVSGSDPITVSQALVFSDRLISDNDPSNDETAFLIDSLINSGLPVPSGLVDPATPDVDFFSPLGAEDETGELPKEYALEQNYPNPFNPQTVISFSLPRNTAVRLEIYNAVGQLIKVLVDGRLESGSHAITWDASDYASGVYFYRLKVEGFTETRKMLLLK
jgi:hypothetical protein